MCIRDRDKEIPGFVSAAIARAMRLAPGERMQSASDLLAAITAPEKDVYKRQV